MKKIISFSLIASGLLASVLCFGAEPTNLSIVKKQAIHYHDSGEYAKDIDRVVARAIRYVKQRVANPAKNDKKLAIVLDIDETSLSNYPDMVRLDFGGTIEEIRADEDKGQDDVITPTLTLYEFAKAHGVAVFFITGRHEDERKVTVENLEKAGYKNYDGLILRFGQYDKAPAAEYKTAMRKELTKKGYDIILNMGDQQSDLNGGFADETFKLPNPYYFIP
jgi:acid phosphatase